MRSNGKLESSTVVIGLAVALLMPRLAAAASLQVTSNEVRLGNAKVELVLDGTTGFFREIINKQTGISHKPSTEGSWPFRIVAGEEIAIDAGSPQRVKYSLSAEEGARTLLLQYDNLLDRTNQPTGVSLSTRIFLGPEADYFLITAVLANKGSKPITSLVAGDGELVTGESEQTDEQLAIPGIGILSRKGFVKRTFGFPPGLDQAELEREFPAVPHDQLGAGWIDYFGKTGGIGIGYIDRRAPCMVFQARSSRPAGGLHLTWRMFDLEWGYWHNQLMNRATATVPLPPGSTFETGEWILAPHAGDWHRMADIYRERYEKHYAGDWQTVEKVPSQLRSSTLVADFIIADQGGAYYIIEHGPGRSVRTAFAEIPKRVQHLAGQLKIPLREIGIKIAGQMPTTFGFPDFFPCYEPAGGTEGAKAMLQQLSEVGIPFTLFYANPWYNNDTQGRRQDQPIVKNFVKEAVVAESLNACRGDIACLDNSAWQSMWRDRLLPEFKAAGVRGIYFDEGQVVNQICAKVEPSAHSHGSETLGVLGGPVRGLVALQRSAREIIGPGGIVAAQGANDVAGRWLDAWQYTDVLMRYTHPQRVYQALITSSTPAEKILEAVAVGAVPELAPEVLPSSLLVQALETARQMRAQSTPGFPYGFRDQLGLAWENKHVSVKAFADAGQGITLVAYATSAANTEVLVDGKTLGLPEVGMQRVSFRLRPGQLLYRVLGGK